MILYRPVGLKELELIAASGWLAFPPRFMWQPIFYPVVTIEYARQIATQWNRNENAAGFAGFITTFTIDDTYVSRFLIQQLGGGPIYRELWVPAEELAEFNRHIVGKIEVVECIYGEHFVGEIDPVSQLPISVLSSSS